MSDLEIYRNRAELLAKSLRERDEALERCGQMIFDLQKEIKSLRVERDDARWEVCELSRNDSMESASEVAIERGWNINFEEESK